MAHRLVVLLLLLLCGSELQAEGNYSPAGASCETTKADVVILVDESGSISNKDFQHMKLFISELVQNVHIGPNSFQIGLTKYSDKVTTEWNLNTHTTKESLLMAVKNIQQKGGGTKIGNALDHVLQHDFSLTAGRRADSKKTVVLITDGRSADRVEIPAKNLKDSGIETYVIGVGKGVDENEMRIIAFGDAETHMYTTSDFESLHNIRKNLSFSLCHSAASNSTHLTTGALCETTKADVVMLVDESGSIYPEDFQLMKLFISELVQNVQIGPNSFQIGLTKYSDAPTTEWNLNTHTTKESLLKAVENIEQNGGGTKIGRALEHILHHSFKPTVGMRPDPKKVAILITDGQSQDNVRPAAKNLKDTGIEIYAIGVGTEVDDSEMRIIASGDVGTYMYTSSEFRYLRDILNSLTLSLCHSSPSPDSVRLVKGASLCSGTLEVKTSQSNQIWSTVCEADFDQQDAEVVCRELGCGPPSVLQGALYGEVEDPTWTAEFQCGGTESSLLDCRRSGSIRDTCSPNKAVSLTCSEPIRLVGGASRCEGTLELKRTEWRPVKGPDWFLMEATVVCGQMKCGSAVSVQKRQNSSVGSVWWISSDCVRPGYPLTECASADLSSSILDVTCSDSVRLVNGASLCSGTLEVKTSQSNQIWSTVCEADFDQQDAEVVCRELGCGPPSVLQGALHGEVEDPTWTAEFQRGGTESSLLNCRRSGSIRNTCSPNKVVRLNCSEPIRLVGGASRCEGTLEVKLGTWKPVKASGWTVQEAAAACRELDCGSVVSMGTMNDSSVRQVWEIELGCLKSGYPLRECASPSLLSSSSQSGTILELVCTDLLVQPIVSVSSSDGVTGALQSSSAGVFQGSSFTISCSIQPQYPGGSFQLSFNSSITTHSYAQPASNHSAHFSFPAAEPGHRGNYSCVYNIHVFSHNFSSESRVLTLSVSDPTVFIIRLVILLLSLLIFISVIYCSHKTTKGQQTVPQKNVDVGEEEGVEEQEEAAL